MISILLLPLHLIKVQLGATTVAMDTDLKTSVYIAEFGNSLKASTAAFKAAIDGVKAGSVKNMVVAAADCHPATPGSALERDFGDGAAALLIGEENVAVTLEASYSIYNEIYDIWRSENDTFVRTWEGRFAVERGYLPTMYEAVSGLMNEYDYKPSDFARAVLYSPDARRGAQVAKSLGKVDNPARQLKKPETWIDSQRWRQRWDTCLCGYHLWLTGIKEDLWIRRINSTR